MGLIPCQTTSCILGKDTWPLFPCPPRGTLRRGAACGHMHLRPCMGVKEPGWPRKSLGLRKHTDNTHWHTVLRSRWWTDCNNEWNEESKWRAHKQPRKMGNATSTTTTFVTGHCELYAGCELFGKFSDLLSFAVERCSKIDLRGHFRLILWQMSALISWYSCPFPADESQNLVVRLF